MLTFKNLAFLLLVCCKISQNAKAILLVSCQDYDLSKFIFCS